MMAEKDRRDRDEQELRLSIERNERNRMQAMLDEERRILE